MALETAANNFERGSRDVFSVAAPDIGALSHVVIVKEGGGLAGDWHLQLVEVLHPGESSQAESGLCVVVVVVVQVCKCAGTVLEAACMLCRRCQLRSHRNEVCLHVVCRAATTAAIPLRRLDERQQAHGGQAAPWPGRNRHGCVQGLCGDKRYQVRWRKLEAGLMELLMLSVPQAHTGL